MTSGPFEGFYKYTLEVTWDTGTVQGGGKSHITLDLGLEACDLVCTPGTFGFDDPAGTSTGKGGCTATYEGSFNCDGDPTTPADGPVIKFDDIDDGCDAPFEGMGTFCFYSLLEPGLDETRTIWIKFGAGECSGEMTGMFPQCTPPLPVEQMTWGYIKALY